MKAVLRCCGASGAQWYCGAVFYFCPMLQECIRYCKYGDADTGGRYTERSASQNGMLLTDYFEAVFVKNNSRQGMNFLRKFNHFMRFRAFRSDI